MRACITHAPTYTYICSCVYTYTHTHTHTHTPKAAYTQSNEDIDAVLHAPMFALNADADRNACEPSHTRSTPTERARRTVRRGNVGAQTSSQARARTRGRTCICIHIHVCVLYIYIYVCMYVCMHIYICVCVYLYIYVCVFVCVCVGGCRFRDINR